MPTLTASAPASATRACGAGGDIAADHRPAGRLRLTQLHAVEHTLRMAVGGVDDDHVDAGAASSSSAFLGTGAHADGSADAQASMTRPWPRSDARSISGCPSRSSGHATRRHRSTTRTRSRRFLCISALRFLGVGAFTVTNSAVAAVMMFGHRLVEVGLEAQVAVGDDTDDGLAVRHHRQHRKSGSGVSAMTSRTVIVGGMVIGSLSTPDSETLDLGNLGGPA